MSDWGVAAVSLFPAAGVFGWLAWAVAHDGLERNGAVGLRIRSTLRSDAAWLAGHRAAAGTIRAVAWVCGVCGVVGVVGAAMEETFGLVAVVLGYVGLLALTIVATVRAHRAARAVED